MDLNLYQKQLLVTFWDRFMKLRKEEQRINLLIEYSKIKIPYKNQQSLFARRKNFNENKNTLHDLSKSVNEDCWVCWVRADIRHHIIQLQHGGFNSKKNLISLCNRCHSKIHSFLPVVSVTKPVQSVLIYAKR